MEIRILAALFFAALVPVFAQPTVTRANLQQSMGFEDQKGPALSGWYGGPPETLGADNTVHHSGQWSVRLQRDDKSAEAFSVITRILPVDFQGGTVELRGWFRLQDVTGNAALWLRQDAGGKMLSLENMDSQQVKGTRDWAQYKITLPINPGAEKLFFGVVLAGKGTLWADDLELLVDGKPIAEALPLQGLPEDHDFDSGSRIILDNLTPTQVANLATLARVWGFLKYHHPAITAGKRHWDYDLFRILPAILAAPDRSHANDVLLSWIDKLGPIPSCSTCVSAPTSDLDIKPPIEWIHDHKLLGVSLSQRLESIYANRGGRQFYVSFAEDVGNLNSDMNLPILRSHFPILATSFLRCFAGGTFFSTGRPTARLRGKIGPRSSRLLFPN